MADSNAPSACSRNRRLDLRLSEQELETIHRKAEEVGVPASRLIRSLAVNTSLSTDREALEAMEAGEDAVLVYDRETYRRLRVQVRACGHHLDQSLHALNTVASKNFMTQKDTKEYMDRAIDVLTDCKAELAAVEAAFKRLPIVPHAYLG